MDRYHEIQYLLEITPRLATAGQPSLEQLEAVADQGYRVVINLGLHDSYYALQDEAAWVEQLGMTYVHIPVDFTAPTLQDFTRFLNAMNLHQDKRCFVHCAENKRVSVFVTLYQIIANHSGQTFKKVEKDSDRDYWMTAQEAKSYGMVDDVLTKNRPKS